MAAANGSRTLTPFGSHRIGSRRFSEVQFECFRVLCNGRHGLADEGWGSGRAREKRCQPCQRKRRKSAELKRKVTVGRGGENTGFISL